MKTIYTICLCFLTVAFSNRASSQGLINGKFENWTVIDFNAPDHWLTPNWYSVSIPDISVTEVPGTSGSAIRLQTGQWAGSYLTNSPYGGLMSSPGGEPYTGQPTGISLSARYHILEYDTARIFVFFKSNGTEILGDTFSITGTDSLAFTTLNFNFSDTFSTTPDSVILLVISSDPFNSVPFGGGFLEIDDFVFTGATQQLVNNTFEDWHVVTVDEPVAWLELGDVTRTTDKYEGNYAAKITTVDEGNGNMLPSSIVFTNTQITTHNFILEGYYKYITTGIDSGLFTLSMAGWPFDDNIGEPVIDVEQTVLPPAAEYTYFSIPLTSDAIETFDFLQFKFTSAVFENMAVAGSQLFVDGLNIVNTTTGVGHLLANSNGLTVFPNPADNMLNIITKDHHTPANVLIYSITGNKIGEYKDLTGKISLPVRGLSPGMYLVELRQGDKIFKTKIFKN